MPPSVGGDFEIKLQIRYFGLKATQYFSKFTPESDATFREDLMSLKLPHPKRDNTTFISHGCIECVWPAVQKDGILHKHIALKSKPPEELLQSLSISNLTIKYIYPQKRKLPQNYNNYTESHPSKNHHNTSQVENHPASGSSGLPFPFKKRSQNENTGRSYETWDSHSQRPHKMLKMDPADDPAKTSEPEQPFPTFKNLPPLPPRKAPERIHVPTPSNTKGPRPSETSHPASQSVESTSKGDEEPASSALGGQKPPTDEKQASFPSANIFKYQKPPDSTQTGSSISSIFSWEQSLAAQLAPLPRVSMVTYNNLPDAAKAKAKAAPPVPSIFNYFAQAEQGGASSSSKASISGLNLPYAGTAFVQSAFNAPNTSFGVKRSPAVSDDVKMEVDAAPSSTLGKAPPKGPKAYIEQINADNASPIPSWYNPKAGCGPPTGPKILRGHYTKPVEASNNPPIKQEYTEDATDFLRDPQPQNPPVTHADNLPAPRTRPSHFQPAERPSTEENDVQVGQDKGANLVQDFLNSIKLKDSISPQVPQVAASSTAVQTERPPQSPFPKVEIQGPQIPSSSSLWQAQPYPQPPTSVAHDPSQERRSKQQWDWYDSSEVPPFRGPAPQVDTTMQHSALPTPPSSASAAAALNTWASWFTTTTSKSESASEQQPSTETPTASTSHLPTAGSAGPLAQSLSSSSSQFQPVSSSSSSPMANKRKRNPTHTKDELMAIQTLLREASDIKREIAAKMAREAVIIAELKALNSNWVPRHIKLGHETQEETEAEVSRLRSELKREKRLREEAENAIMDVRRECKEPFVVPSLLDAFVEVSKLTTRSLRPPEASQIAATAHPDVNHGSGTNTLTFLPPNV